MNNPDRPFPGELDRGLNLDQISMDHTRQLLVTRILETRNINEWQYTCVLTNEQRALSPADLFGGRAPVGALIGLLERIC